MDSVKQAVSRPSNHYLYIRLGFNTTIMTILNGTSINHLNSHCYYVHYHRAVSWLRRLVAVLPTRRPEFDPASVDVGFLVDKVALGQVFPHVLRFSPFNFIPPVLCYLEK